MFFLFVFLFFILVLSAAGSVRGYLQTDSVESQTPPKGSTRCISSGFKSLVPTASERVQCKHEGLPLPAQSAGHPPPPTTSTKHEVHPICHVKQMNRLSGNVYKNFLFHQNGVISFFWFTFPAFLVFKKTCLLT